MMTYQPNLYVFNTDNTSSKSIYQVIKDLGFGKVNYVERENGGAYVAMDYWDTKITASTRLKLQQGKPLLLYYSDEKFWKVYSYEHRFAEEEHKKRIEKTRSIQLKRQAAAVRKEREEKNAQLRREREYKIRREREEKEAEIRRQEEIDEMLEALKQVSINEQASMAQDEYDSMDEHEHRQAFDVDEANSKIAKVVLDYGDAINMYPAIKERAKKLRDRLKIGYKK
jgi:flagellar biosynthesis GTPase FlhF